MALQEFPGSRRAYIGPTRTAISMTTPTTVNTSSVDAANEAIICIGYMETSDGGSHTIDTSGSSAMEWRAGTATFADGGTTVKVGLAAVDTANGPPGRAVNSSNIITFDVFRAMNGSGSPEITASAWQTHVPNSGSKTIAHGDLVAFAIQMTAKAGSDAVAVVNSGITSSSHLPSITQFTASYANIAGGPNCFITFSDGATGWFYGGDVFSARDLRVFSNTESPDERGQLFQLPFPMKIFGAYAWADPDANFDIVLYSDPLGTVPVAERTSSIDANTTASATGRLFEVLFSSPYEVGANDPVAIVVKPTTASTIGIYSKTQASATHRISDPWGTSGYGVGRTDGSGAFADLNSSLEHTFIGLIVGAFSNGVGALEYLRPDADSIDGTWTDQGGGTSLFAAIDEEEASDTDYIVSTPNPVNDTCKIRLSDPGTTPGEPFTIEYRYRKSGGTQINLRVRLLQGSTEIAAWTHNDISTSFVDGEQTLTGEQFADITDFTDLFLEFTANPS